MEADAEPHATDDGTFAIFVDNKVRDWLCNEEKAIGVARKMSEAELGRIVLVMRMHYVSAMPRFIEE
jgi:hypothetical protein